MKRTIFLVLIIVLIALGITYSKKEPEIPDIDTISTKTTTNKPQQKEERHVPRQNVREGFRALTFEIPIRQLPSNFKVTDILDIYSNNRNLVIQDAQVLNLKLEENGETALVAIEVRKNDVKNFIANALSGPMTFIEQNRAYSFVYKLAQQNVVLK